MPSPKPPFNASLALSSLCHMLRSMRTESDRINSACRAMGTFTADGATPPPALRAYVYHANTACTLWNEHMQRAQRAFDLFGAADAAARRATGKLQVVS